VRRPDAAAGAQRLPGYRSQPRFGAFALPSAYARNARPRDETGRNQIVPNSVQLDQAILRFERVPDSVQTDRMDWGFRFTHLQGLAQRTAAADVIVRF